MTTWILERIVFDDLHDRLARAAKSAGHRVVDWPEGGSADLELADTAGPILFHGSLETAVWVSRNTPWKPGAYCAVDAFTCSTCYPGATAHLVHQHWFATTAQQLVDSPARIPFDHDGQVFVRPDSPLKPFSGRVVNLDDLHLESLDFGFYYDDPHLAIIVAPVVEVLHEWRFVIACDRVVAGSVYTHGREGSGTPSQSAPAWTSAQQVADDLAAPECVYVLDVAEVLYGDELPALRLLEINPFSGADLYDCDRHAIVAAVEQAMRR